MARRKTYSERVREKAEKFAQERAKTVAAQGGDPFQDFLQEQEKRRKKYRLATPEQKAPTRVQEAQKRFADVQAGGGDPFQDFLSQAQKAEETRQRNIPEQQSSAFKNALQMFRRVAVTRLPISSKTKGRRL